MTTATSVNPVPPPESPTQVSWRSWPLVDAAPWSLLVPSGLVVAAVLVQWIVGSLAWGLLAAALLAVTLWRFLLPVRFTISSSGVAEEVFGRQRFIPFRMIGRYEVRRHGVFLFRAADAMTLDAFRGLYLPWGRYREEVIELLWRHIGEREVKS